MRQALRRQLTTRSITLLSNARWSRPFRLSSRFLASWRVPKPSTRYGVERAFVAPLPLSGATLTLVALRWCAQIENFLVTCIKSMSESVRPHATRALTFLLSTNPDEIFPVFFAHAVQSVGRYPVVAASYGQAILSEIRSRPQYYITGFRCKLYVAVTCPHVPHRVAHGYSSSSSSSSPFSRRCMGAASSCRLLFALFYQNSPYVELQELGVNVVLELSGASLKAHTTPAIAAAAPQVASDATAAASAIPVEALAIKLDATLPDADLSEEAIAAAIAAAAAATNAEALAGISDSNSSASSKATGAVEKSASNSAMAVAIPTETEESDLIIPDRFLPTTYFGVTGLGTVNLAKRFSEAVAAKYMTLTRELFDEFFYFSDLLASDAELLSMLQVRSYTLSLSLSLSRARALSLLLVQLAHKLTHSHM